MRHINRVAKMINFAEMTQLQSARRSNDHDRNCETEASRTTSTGITLTSDTCLTKSLLSQPTVALVLQLEVKIAELCSVYLCPFLSESSETGKVINGLELSDAKGRDSKAKMMGTRSRKPFWRRRVSEAPGPEDDNQDERQILLKLL